MVQGRYAMLIYVTRKRLDPIYYVSVFENLRIRPPTRMPIRSSLKNFHSGDRTRKIPDTVTEFAGYVWTQATFGKKIRIQKFSGMCGRGLSKGMYENLHE